MNEIDFNGLREIMVKDQFIRRGIVDPYILKAFRNVPRHFFVPKSQERFAYDDCSLSIGLEQTISQPYMVALMTQTLKLEYGMSTLEIGTGSGYQSAIISFLGSKVYTVERIPELADSAQKFMDSLGYNVLIKVGDGTLGWLEHACYDRIIVTAASPEIPESLINQLKIKGKMVIPVGDRYHQKLILINKISENKIKKEIICNCVFVPLIGKYGWQG